MNRYYIINNTVLFYPEEHRLATIGKEDSDILLNIPASRCLALLIERKGGLITQKEFFAEVWEAQGTYVTQNTFYQNISLLRKGLKAAGLGETPIKTVLKRGMTLGEGISIEVREGEYDEVTTSVFDSAEPEAPAMIPTQIPESPESPEMPEIPKSRSALHELRWYFLLCGVLFTLFSALYYSERFMNQDYFAHYTLFNNDKSCKVMIPAHEKITDIYYEFINNSRMACESGRVYYLTMLRDDRRVSVFACNKEIHFPDASCTSYFYMENKNG